MFDLFIIQCNAQNMYQISYFCALLFFGVFRRPETAASALSTVRGLPWMKASDVRAAAAGPRAADAFALIRSLWFCRARLHTLKYPAFPAAAPVMESTSDQADLETALKALNELGGLKDVVVENEAKRLQDSQDELGTALRAAARTLRRRKPCAISGSLAGSIANVCTKCPWLLPPPEALDDFIAAASVRPHCDEAVLGVLCALLEPPPPAAGAERKLERVSPGQCSHAVDG